MDPYYFLNPNLHASSGARAGGIADFSADAASGPRVCKDSPGHGLPCLVMLQTVRLPDGVNGEYNLGIQGRQLGITSAGHKRSCISDSLLLKRAASTHQCAVQRCWHGIHRFSEALVQNPRPTSRAKVRKRNERRERTEGGERKPSGSHRGPPALRPFLKPVSSMRKSPPFPKRKGQFGHA